MPWGMEVLTRAGVTIRLAREICESFPTRAKARKALR